ncbi:nicotinate phosphoribosyltransferase [Lacticaseibacillus zhaodongensis]|uniref:nicotinate phosphoribosyltransferase n=1 Tax=Lacticaseibacillus zhaodongensis TaxID=2668065 RepID=UPI0012D2EF5E|nr:nicotinate phosphoribosyltransferase [Lacticaseibacillus zhaodongensis]
MERNLSLLTDLYEFTMANGFKQELGDDRATFDIFFRNVPDDGSFVVTAGLAQAVAALKNFHFDDSDVEYFRSLHLFSDDFLNYLHDFKLDCSVTAIPEGTPVFPREPLLTISGPLVQTQLLETLLLNIINHQSLIATKARRITYAAAGRPVMEFGARRAQGPDSATYGSRAAVIGGCASTSNVAAAKEFGIPAAGTMAHSWIESFPSELASFRAWAKIYPDNCALLVDTYDVLRSGVPNAILVFKELKKSGHKPVGIRIDSGDITVLARKARKMMDEAGFKDAKITASNALDESVITSLQADNAPIDNYGIGEKLITSSSSPVLSGVYKLAATEHNGKITPKIKVSATRSKTTLPGIKKVYRLYHNGHHHAFADIIALADEEIVSGQRAYNSNPLATSKETVLDDFRAVPLQQTVDLSKTEPVTTDVFGIQAYSKQRLAELPHATKRLINPDTYTVYITKNLYDLQQKLEAEELR